MFLLEADMYIGKSIVSRVRAPEDGGGLMDCGQW